MSEALHDTIATNKISPQDVLSWDEEPSRQPFTSGKGLFMRNWSYVYPIAQDAKASQVVDKVGVAPLPSFPGGKSSACLGGYQLGVNANSKQREAAIELLTWLSSTETQHRIALNFGLAPTRPALFQDAPKGAFPLTVLFNRAAEQGRLHGLRIDGIWMHVGTPEAVIEAETAMMDSAA